MNRKKELEDLSKKIRNCKKCRLWKNRKEAVPGEGPFDASIIFVGEAPGNKEDLMGKPFVGRSGKLFTELLETSSLDRGDFYITSVIKCHPTGNRTPKSDELQTCIQSWMIKQISLIHPDLIVILGGIALKSLVDKEKIKRYHGKIISKNNKKFFITYHPAAGLRNPKIKKIIENDFNNLSNIIYSESR